MPAFRLVIEAQVDADHYSHYRCVAETDADLRTELAEVVRGLYVDEDALAGTLRDASVGLGQVADDAAIQTWVNEVVAAVVPPGETPRGPDDPAIPPTLELSRNELGEVIAHLAAQKIYGTVVPSRRIRHKEVPGRPSRGMDLLGVDLDPPALVLGEVKTSTSTDTPPHVVGDSQDSLRSQLVRLIADRPRVLRELSWALTHAPSAYQATLGEVMLRFLKREVRLVALAALVRPAEIAAESDYGCFRDDRAQFRPAVIRFCLLSVDEPIAELARDVYDDARVST